VKTLIKDKIVSYDDKIDVEFRAVFDLTLRGNQTPKLLRSWKKYQVDYPG